MHPDWIGLVVELICRAFAHVIGLDPGQHKDYNRLPETIRPTLFGWGLENAAARNRELASVLGTRKLIWHRIALRDKWSVQGETASIRTNACGLASTTEQLSNLWTIFLSLEPELRDVGVPAGDPDIEVRVGEL